MPALWKIPSQQHYCRCLQSLARVGGLCQTPALHRLSPGATMPCSCLLQAQATGQPAHSHWHSPPGSLLATAATPTCPWGSPDAPAPHSPCASCRQDPRGPARRMLAPCWRPVDGREWGIFEVHQDSAPWPRSSRGAATGTTRNVHLPRAAAAARTAHLGLSPGAPSHQDGKAGASGRAAAMAQLTTRPASSKSCSPRVLELSPTQEGREGRDQHPLQEQGRARCCVLPWMMPMRCRQAGSAALTHPTSMRPCIWKPESPPCPIPGYGNAEHPLLRRGTMPTAQRNAEGQQVDPSPSTAFHTGSGGTAPHIASAASQADKELACSRTGLGQLQSSTSSTDSHSSADRLSPSSHQGTEVRDLPLAQKGAPVCSPAAPQLGPLTRTAVSQQPLALKGLRQRHPACCQALQQEEASCLHPRGTQPPPCGVKGQAGGAEHTSLLAPTLNRGVRGRDPHPPAPCTGWCWPGIGTQHSPASCWASA